LPAPLRGTWHGCFEFVAKLKECGTAFRRRLAIQFSKTERTLGYVSSPSPCRAEVAKTTVLAKGEVDLLPSPGTVKKVRGGQRLRRFLDRGDSPSTRIPLLRQESITEASPLRHPPERALLLLPPRSPVKKKKPGEIRLLVRPFVSPGGQPSTPFVTDPLARSGDHIDLARLPGAADLLPRAPRCQAVRAGTSSRSQRDTSRRPRLSSAATASAAGSTPPATRARSLAMIASSWRSAASRSSFTTR
jgi:hypothetical protein